MAKARKTAKAKKPTALQALKAKLLRWIEATRDGAHDRDEAREELLIELRK